jgi:hypothetical protein
MPTREFPPELKNYRLEWVAISREERVVGHGPRPEDALSQAETAGHKDVTLMFVPEEWPQVQIL